MSHTVTIDLCSEGTQMEITMSRGHVYLDLFDEYTTTEAHIKDKETIDYIIEKLKEAKDYM